MNSVNCSKEMNNIPLATNKRTSYENFVAECPSCHKECIFNRASDLKTFEPISGRDVSCLECGKPFRIIGDSINNAHEMLIFDCYELLEHKHYMNCILNLTQAYEVFFSLFFRVELIFKPFGADPTHNIDELNRLLIGLSEKIKTHTFAPLRALFLQHMVNGHTPSNLIESANAITALPDKPGDPRDAAIEGLGDANLVKLLKALKATRIHELRNRIVHQRAYRPPREKVEAALTETRDILFPLTNHLKLYDEINWYMIKR